MRTLFVQPRRVALIVAAVVSFAVIAFGVVQNTTGARGGEIALAKMLWLNLTLLVFIALPLVLWRSAPVPRRLRLCFGIVGISFLVRGAIELPVLYFTEGWKCAYGMTHDVMTAAVVIAVWSRQRRRSDGDVLVLVTVLLCGVEAAFAWAFCSVADPAATWFANGSEEFDDIIAFTWAAVIVFYPLYASLAWRVLGLRRE